MSDTTTDYVEETDIVTYESADGILDLDESAQVQQRAEWPNDL